MDPRGESRGCPGWSCTAQAGGNRLVTRLAGPTFSLASWTHSPTLPILSPPHLAHVHDVHSHLDPASRRQTYVTCYQLSLLREQPTSWRLETAARTSSFLALFLQHPPVGKTLVELYLDAVDLALGGQNLPLILPMPSQT